MVYWWQQEYRFWFAWVWVLLHVLYNQKSCGWAFAKKAPPGGKLFCLWLKIWTCFGEAPEQGRSLPFWTETSMSLSLLKYLFWFAAAWEGFWDIRLLCTVGKAIVMLSFVNCLASQSFYTQSIKRKERDYFCFVFSVAACVWTVSSLGQIFRCARYLL